MWKEIQSERQARTRSQVGLYWSVMHFPNEYLQNILVTYDSIYENLNYYLHCKPVLHCVFLIHPLAKYKIWDSLWCLLSLSSHLLHQITTSIHVCSFTVSWISSYPSISRVTAIVYVITVSRLNYCSLCLLGIQCLVLIPGYITTIFR